MLVTCVVFSPQELDEIYIDASNTLNVAIEGQALMLLTKVRALPMPRPRSEAARGI